MSDAKFLMISANAIGIALNIDPSKVIVINVAVVSGANDFGEAQQRGRNRMLSDSEAEQSLNVEYRIITERATDAKRIQAVLENPKDLAMASASVKKVLSEEQLASGRSLLIKEVSLAPAMVTTVVGSTSSSISPSSTSTTSRQEEHIIRTAAPKEKGGHFNAITVVVASVATVVGGLFLASLAKFLLVRRGRELLEQNSTDEKEREDLERGPEQQDESSVMYPTLLKIPSQSCKSVTEMKPAITASGNMDTQDSGNFSDFVASSPLPASQESHTTIAQNLEPCVEMKCPVPPSEPVVFSEIEVVLPDNVTSVTL